MVGARSLALPLTLTTHSTLNSRYPLSKVGTVDHLSETCGGGRGASPVKTGDAPLRVPNPFPFKFHFCAKWYPFHIPRIQTQHRLPCLP